MGVISTPGGGVFLLLLLDICFENNGQVEKELSEKELQIIRYVIDGKTSIEIASLMCLSEETIKWYRKRLLRRFDAKNFASLVHILIEKGLL